MNKENWLQNPNEWQFVDPANGFIFPWLTLDFLEHLITFDIANWKVFETGSGCGTLWWAVKCKEVVTLETNKDWMGRIYQFAERKNITNIKFNLVEVNENWDDSVNRYLSVLQKQQQKFDAIIIDGIFRDYIASISDQYIKDGGWLIVDNYLQKDVESIMNSSKVLNTKYPIKIFKQSPIVNPVSHPWIWDGNKECFSKISQGHPEWKTAYWKIQNENNS